jgi:dolichol-phosphate mannosyltransferase
MKKISMILPVYNEADGITAFHSAIVEALSKLQYRYEFEIIYIVDKSKDNSLDILKGIAHENPNVLVLGLSRRFGHQMSLVAGIDNCTGDAAIMMDSDFEHPPELVSVLLECYEKGFDIVRTRREYGSDVSIFKRWSSTLYYKFLNFLSEEKMSQNSADFRLISRKVIDVFKVNIREHNQYLRGLFSWVGFEQTEVTFTSEKRKIGKSKYSFRRLLSFGLQGIVSFSKVPLKLSIVIGMIIAVAGIAYGLLTAIERIVNPDIAPAGWVSIIVIMLIIGGVQLIMLGVIGEYIASIFDEVKGRPLYIIESCYGKTVNKFKISRTE